MTKLQSGHKCVCVPLNSYCDKVKLQNVSVTLTFEIGT
jgi:hypothetical protein